MMLMKISGPKRDKIVETIMCIHQKYSFRHMGKFDVWEHVAHIGKYRNAYIYLKKKLKKTPGNLGVDGVKFFPG